MINVNVSRRIFNDAYLPYLNDQRQTQIFFGGSSSGKSYFILGQRTILDLLAGGRNFLICRNVARSSRDSTFNEMQKGIESFGVQKEFKINKSDMTITCANGYQAIFKGLDDIEKVKSITPRKGVLTDVVNEEATEISYEKTKQQRKRLRGKTNKSKRITYLFNPIQKTHWIYKEHFAGRFGHNDTKYEDERLLILKTTYKDNLKFLGEDEVYDLENETNEYFKNVYTYGNWGVLGDLIFNNWKAVDLSEILNKGNNYRNGLDFGFANDPAAMSRSFRRGNQIFITHCPSEIYTTGLVNKILAQRLKTYVGREPVVCDSAEPKSIKELTLEGITALGAKKGKDSEIFHVQWLQGMEILVHYELQEAINELSLFQWEKDRDGNTIPKPWGKQDHFISALRYSYEKEMYSSGANAQKVKY